MISVCALCMQHIKSEICPFDQKISFTLIEQNGHNNKIKSQVGYIMKKRCHFDKSLCALAPVGLEDILRDVVPQNVPL